MLQMLELKYQEDAADGGAALILMLRYRRRITPLP